MRNIKLISLGTLASVQFLAACGDADNSGGNNTGAAPNGGSSTGGSSTSGSSNGGAPTGGGGSSSQQFMDGVGGNMGCEGLECNQVDCTPSTVTTTISGKVYEPAGKTPLYNVVVYIPKFPEQPLPEIVDGATCDTCAASIGSVVASAITDAAGNFVLEDVPVGVADLPLVIQVGKWRRSFTVPAVTECGDTPLADTTIRLPRNQSEGHIPKIALTTGGADPLECLLPKIGLDLAEFTNPDGTGRINLFSGPGGGSSYAAGGAFPYVTQLWSTVDQLKAYDLVLMACEGGPNPGDKPATALQAMQDYTSQGGRVFASHWHNYWAEGGPQPFPTVATFNHQADLPSPFTAKVDMSFPKGLALAQWLVNVNASTVQGDLVLVEAQHTIDAVNVATSTRWVYGESPTSIQYLTFNTPIGVAEEEQCGRMVISDIHVSSGDSIGQPFPNGCTTTDLSPQEKALLFMLFDLSACLIPDDDPPEPPPPE